MDRRVHDVVLLVGAALAAGLSSPVAVAQTKLFDWTLLPGVPGGYSSMSEYGIGVIPAFSEPAGTIRGYTAVAPVDLWVWTTVSYNSFDGVCGKCAAVALMDGTWTAQALCDTEENFKLQVGAGSTFGLGVKTLSPTWPAQVGDFPLTFAPPPRFSLTGAGGDELGTALANVGDLNGDGVDDLAAGAPATGAHVSIGTVRLMSGSTGAVLLVLESGVVDDGFGTAVAAAGDLDLDGVVDVAVGAPRSDLAGADAGIVWICSGADGSILRALPGEASGEAFGGSVAGGGDADGDGRPDLLIGASGADEGTGRVTVFSGADLSILGSLPGFAAGGHFGYAVAFGGDLDGDGDAELIVGSPDEDPGPEPGSGVVRVLTLQDSRVLHAFSTTSGSRFGAAVDGGGDLDADGTSDVLVGMPSPSSSGRVRAYSGATGALIHELSGLGGFAASFGYSVAIAGDVDGDARPDILVGEPELDSISPNIEGRAYVFSGRDGKRIAVFGGDAEHDRFGSAVCDAGDADDDGVHEFAMGAPGIDQPGVEAGELIVQGLFAHWTNVGGGLAGAAGEPWLSALGLPYAGSPISLKLSGAAPASPAVLVLGASAAYLPFKGGVLVPSPQLLIGGLVTGAVGDLVLAGHWPPGVASGLQLYLQFWMVDASGPAGLSASNGLHVDVP